MTLTAPPAAGAKLRASVLAALIGELQPSFQRKLADESVSSATTGTTYQSDAELAAPVVADAVYMCHLHMVATSPVAADIKIRLSLPAGATATNWSLQHIGGGPFLVSSMTTGLAVGASAADETFDYVGLIVTSSTAGTAQVEWAQLVADATNTTVRAGSFLTLVRQS